MFNNSNIKFKYSWRPYQQNVLDEVAKHIKDKKIHIVAAPGSGKTVLGLELARSLKSAVLILSPTLTIKHQWIDRFVTLFMQDDSQKPEWISENIYDLKYFNSVTYQGLHYAYKKQKARKSENEDSDDEEIFQEKISEDIDIDLYSLVEEIKKQNIKTIVLDEAHHLKTQWWDSLTKVIEDLGDVTLISLTATPPYDVEYSQFKKYMDLCGAIDAEISVPELVAVDNLCPHQDYVYFNYPTEKEKKYILEYKEKIKNFLEDIKSNVNFVNAIKNHPYMLNTQKYQSEILQNPEYYSSMIIYLNSANIKIDKSKIKVLGHTKKIPKLDLEWLEILLQNCIFSDRDNYIKNEEVISKIEEQINDIGAIEKKKIMFVNNKSLQKYFVNSIGKLNSINDIVKIESNSLKQDLRMVILTDFIRKEYLQDPSIELNKLGVFPIFISVLNKNPNVQIAILTGSLFAIPKEKKNLLIKECIDLGIDENKIIFTDLSISDKYLIVKTADIFRNLLMKSIAKLFSDGNINIIIGTKSLLGEGWDEPSINCLILASFVGSYMLSNQMRGRAIRTNDNPRKTANIWHLVCISGMKDNFIKNVDYEMLKRRFNCFVGIGYKKDIIESGMQRIDIIPKFINEFSIDKYKNEVATVSVKRNEMYDKWKRLSNEYGKDNIRVVQNIQMEKQELNNKFEIINFKKVLIAICIIIVLYFIRGVLIGYDLEYGDSKNSLGTTILVGIINVILFIIISWQTISITIKALLVGVPQRLIKQIAKITLYSLCRFGYIKTDFDDIKIISVNNNNDVETTYLECYIVGATPYENNIFVKSMKEIFSRVENQRYIIVKNRWNIKRLSLYYNVPSLLAQNKDTATVFFDLWNRKIENSKLVYTHTQDGREILMNARTNSFDYNEKVFEKQKVVSVWK